MSAANENHINESILSDEIKEHQKANRIDDIMQDLTSDCLICPLGKREQIKVFFTGLEYYFDICPLFICTYKFI